MNKFKIGQKVFLWSIDYPHDTYKRLVKSFIISLIEFRNDGVYYYGENRHIGIKEDFIYEDRDKAYKKLIVRAENERNSSEN